MKWTDANKVEFVGTSHRLDTLDRQEAKTQFFVLGLLSLVLGALIIYQQSGVPFDDIQADESMAYQQFLDNQDEGFELLSRNLSATNTIPENALDSVESKTIEIQAH
jgi:hypothetical protein